MNNSDIRESYLDWLETAVCQGRRYSKRKEKYSILLKALFEKEFYYIIPMDQNRYEDGVFLRYYFAREKDIDYQDAEAELDIYPCSVLEMMIALANKMESITEEDTASYWFWKMIFNLGLEDLVDASFDEEFFNATISAFVSRDYDRSGRGGLFKVNDDSKDMRLAEIWYQMCWYLDESVC